MKTGETKDRLREVESIRKDSGAVAEQFDNLHSQFKMYRELLVHAAIPFISIDESSTVVEWNKAAERVFGWSVAEAVGTRLTDLIIPEREAARHNAGMARYLTTGEGNIIDRRVQLTARTKAGDELEVYLTVRRAQINGTRSLFGALVYPVP